MQLLLFLSMCWKSSCLKGINDVDFSAEQHLVHLWNTHAVTTGILR